MKKFTLINLLLFATIIVAAQGKKMDTLRVALSKATAPDTVRLNILKELSHSYFDSTPDSAIIFGQEYYELAVKFGRVKDQGTAVNYMANAYSSLGDYTKCFPLYFKAIKIYESINYLPGIVNEYSNIGDGYVKKQEYLKALPYLRLGLKKWDQYASTHKLTTYGQNELRAYLFINIAEVFLYSNKIDSADHYLRLGYPDAKIFDFQEILDNIVRDLGEVETARGHKEAALNYYRDAVSISSKTEDVQMQSITYLSIANLYHKYNQGDSAEYYGLKALETASTKKLFYNALNASAALAAYYEQGRNLPQAIKYLKETVSIKDSIFAEDKEKQLLSANFDEKQRAREIASIKVAQKKVLDNIKLYIVITALGVFILFALVFWRQSKQKQKMYNMLQNKKKETELHDAGAEDATGTNYAPKTNV